MLISILNVSRNFVHLFPFVRARSILKACPLTLFFFVKSKKGQHIFNGLQTGTLKKKMVLLIIEILGS